MRRLHLTTGICKPQFDLGPISDEVATAIINNLEGKFEVTRQKEVPGYCSGLTNILLDGKGTCLVIVEE